MVSAMTFRPLFSILSALSANAEFPQYSKLKSSITLHVLKGFVMVKYGREVCFSTVGEPKLCHLFARSKGFVEYSYEIKKKGGKEKSKHFLAACGTASEDCPIFRFEPSLLTSQLQTQMLPAQ